ncbi:hypothetical protein FRB96_003453 [Tulasnella sp. 330]|nr:hypothetical protein FRB96_003453 [Tulasnella sp. 330]
MFRVHDGGIRGEMLDTAMQLVLEAADSSGTSGAGNKLDRSSSNPNTRLVTHEDIDQIEICFSELERRVRTHVAHQRRILNDRRPINRLREELLVRIFFLSLQGEIRPKHVLNIYRLSRVCFSWNDIVNESSQLWGVVASQDSSRTLNEMIYKSRNTPLDVKIYGGKSLNDDDNEGRLSRFILPHAHRWRSLDVVEDVVIVPNETLRQLMHLELEGGGLHWDLCALTGLRALHLKGPGLAIGVPSSHLLAALQASPKLVELNLVDLFLVGSVTDDMSPLVLYSKATTNAIKRVLDSQTNHLFDTIRSILVRAQKCRVTLRERKMEFVGLESMIAVHVDLPVTSFASPLGWLNTVLSSIIPPPSINLEIATAIDLISPIRETTVLDAEGAVTSLRLSDACDVGRWTDYLTKPMAKDGTERWGFDNMRRLTVETGEVMEPRRMEAMVRAPAGHGIQGTNGSQGSQKGLSRSLEVLTIGCLETCGVDDQNRIKSFLEEGAQLSWKTYSPGPRYPRQGARAEAMDHYYA